MRSLTGKTYMVPTRKPENEKATLKNGLSVCFYWCPRTESNRYLMITNQLHDLHATGAPDVGQDYSPITRITT